MKVRELVNSREFCFNAKYRIAKFDFRTRKETTLCTDEDDDGKYDLWEITAINQDDDGTVSINCIQI